MSDPMSVDTAIDIVARDALCRGFTHVAWSDYPDLGEFDWQRVVAAAERIVLGLDAVTFDAAYRLLAARADVTLDGQPEGETR
jgi:hypothetical protein